MTHPLRKILARLVLLTAAPVTAVLPAQTATYSWTTISAVESSLDPGITGMCLDNAGDLFVASGLSGTVRKISPTGAVSTPFSAAAISHGQGIFDLVVDNANSVHLLANSGNVTTIAPTGEESLRAFAVARFARQITCDIKGNLFVTAPGAGGNVLKISPDNTMTATAVNDDQSFGNRGLWGIAVDHSNNLYVSSFGKIYRVNPGSGSVSPFASFLVAGLCCDAVGNLYGGEGGVIHRMAPDGTASAITGPFPSASCIAVDGVGNLYVASGFSDNPTATIYKGLTSLPLNDSLANAAQIIGTTSQFTVRNANATRESSEPHHAGRIGGHSLWWTWTAPADGLVAFTTAGSSFTPLLAAYQGRTVGNLNPVASSTSGVMGFTATANTTYRIAADGPDGATGTIVLSLAPAAVPAISAQPAPCTVTAGQTATFSVTATAAPAPLYQWQRLPAGSSTWSRLGETATCTGTANTTLTIKAAAIDQSGDQFRCLIGNWIPPAAVSEPATLTVKPPVAGE